VFAILEHEAMHQETLLYMWHRLPLEQKQRPAGYTPRVGGTPPPQSWIDVPGGRVTLGQDAGDREFGWDNERPSATATVEGFEVQPHDVTNAAYLEFVDAGGYGDPQWWRPEDFEWIRSQQMTHPLFWERHDGQWFWRGIFDLLPLPLAWPVYV